ncbi:MAG: tRNA dihydrouridine synthase DusB, partial [Pseudomonadota bacterium]
RAFLAPMSGVTDVPFRNLAWQLGAGLVVSEMVASQALIEGEQEMALKMLRSKSDVHMVQLAGREAKWMTLAAKLAQDSGADIVDINMGCPAKRVTTGYSGSALMRDLDHAMGLIEATIGAVSVPVTLKMRLGWDRTSINAPELAKLAESAGVKMITVHGRTRCQFYKGKADWTLVRRVREATSLPLVVNGDVVDQQSAQTALSKSGADAVMIGRGAYGKPWQPGLIAGSIGLDEAKEHAHDPQFVVLHHKDVLSTYGEAAGIRQARKHLAWYFDNLCLPGTSIPLRRRILTSFDVDEIQRLIPELFAVAEHEASQSDQLAVA